MRWFEPGRVVCGALGADPWQPSRPDVSSRRFRTTSPTLRSLGLPLTGSTSQCWVASTRAAAYTTKRAARSCGPSVTRSHASSSADDSQVCSKRIRVGPFVDAASSVEIEGLSTLGELTAAAHDHRVCETTREP